MKAALRTAGGLAAGAFILGAFWLALPVLSVKQALAPPDPGARPPDLSVVDPPPAAAGKDPPASAGVIPSGDPAADWARIHLSTDPRDYEAYLRAHPFAPWAIDAQHRLMLLSNASIGQPGERAVPPGAVLPGPGAPDPAEAAEAALRGQFRLADIAFNAPRSMIFRQTARIELALSPQTAGVAPGSRLSLDLPGEIVTVEGVDYALRMQATLSGQDFEIEPEGPVARTVLSDRPTTWDWTAKPLTHGPDKPLTLRLEAVIARDGRDLPPVGIETFSAAIMVEVTTWDRAVEIAKDFSPLHATLVAVSGTAIAAIGWLWRQRRAPPPPPPQQVEVTHRFADGGGGKTSGGESAPAARRGPVSR